jgi:hypothetical protein
MPGSWPGSGKGPQRKPAKTMPVLGNERCGSSDASLRDLPERPTVGMIHDQRTRPSVA